MRKKKLIFALIVVIIGIVGFISGWWIKSIECEETIHYDYVVKLDSLKNMEFVREEGQLPYKGMIKEKVLEMLPEPKYHYPVALFYDKKSAMHWLYSPIYEEKLKRSKDTIHVETYYWEIPYHDRPSLYIVFENINNEWIATACVQWNPRIVQF